MHPLVNNILERPKSHQIFFWIVSLLIVCGLSWQYLVKSVWDEKDSLVMEIENLQVKILEQRRIARDLPKFKAEVENYDNKLELLIHELPDSKEIPDLLTSISVLAVDTGLEVVQFTPRPEVMQNFYASVPVDIELEGTFHQLATFFDEVGHMSRVVNIDNITIEILTESNSEVLIRAFCRAVTFRYLTDEERAKLVKPAAPQKGRRRKAK
jgi:type IV pilus assembly protein PilO